MLNSLSPSIAKGYEMGALSIGSIFNVFEPAAVAKAMETSEGQSNALLTRVLKDLHSRGPERFLVKPSGIQCLDEVAEACPHFLPVIEDLRKYVALALSGTSSLSFAPILLAGDPGVGKTYFAKQLGKALGVSTHFISMSSVSASWVISGAAPTWHGAKQGKVAQTLIAEFYANPLFLLDEIDKVGGDPRYDPTGTLLELLEKDTASHFHDEFLDMDFDASQAMWVGTANNVDALPSPLKSRMLVYEISPPTPAQSAHIAQRVFTGLRESNGFDFEPVLSEDVKERLSSIAPREMRLKLLEAMGAACVANRRHVTPDDVKLSKPAKVMGFTH